MKSLAPNAPPTVLEKMASFGYAIKEADDESSLVANLPDFPCDNLNLIAKGVEANPLIAISDSVDRLYPYRLFLPKDSHKSLASLCESLNIPPSDHRRQSRIVSVDKFGNDALSKRHYEMQCLASKL